MFTLKQICAMQDHSLLGHCCPREDVQRFADEVLEYGFRSLVVNGDKVEYGVQLLEGRADVCAVVSFPQGAGTIEAKVFEAVDAVKKGAAEVDTVVNFSRMRNGEYDYVKREIAQVVQAAKDVNPDVVTKFIIYFPYDQDNPLRLTEDEISRVGEYIIEGGGDFIKYHGSHAFIVQRFRTEVEKGIVQLKWSGCPDLPALAEGVRLGVSRCGTDSKPQQL